MSARRISTVVLAALALVWVACAGGPSPIDHFYRLVPKPGPTALAAPILDGTLEVARFRAEAITLERPLLYRLREDSAEVNRSGFHRWVDSPPTMLQQQTANYLRRAGVAPSVVTPEMRIDAEYELGGRIARLERVIEGTPRVVIELEFTLTHVPGRKLLLHETYRAERDAAGSDVEDAARAFDEAYGDVLARLVTDLARR